MEFSYKKLWKLLIDKNMNKRMLSEQAGISNTTVAKLGKGDNVNMEVLLKICKALNCDISDIVEVVRTSDDLNTEDNSNG